MKKTCFSLTLAVLLGLSSQASAVIGTIDNVPAATLLLPYFEVDIVNNNGVNTLFSINNASDKAVLAHVTLWTDHSVPALSFDVYLTGYDVQSLDLRNIFVNGNLPRTASTGQDPLDTISPRGPDSQDLNFSSCSSLPYTNPAISPSFRAHLQAWFQGSKSPATGNCAGFETQDGIMRGYVTVDTVNACNLFFPSDWAFYSQYVTDQNVLWGSYLYLNPALSTAEGNTLVHIESCPSCFQPGDHTFYGRYNAAAADDSREALPTTMAAQYGDGGIWSKGTDFFVWREANASAAAYSCALKGPASWYPLESAAIVLYDEQEQAVITDSCLLGNPSCSQDILIPNETQRVDVTVELQTPFSSGWATLALQHLSVVPIYGDQYAQMWMTTTLQGGGFSAAFEAVQFDNANRPCGVTCTSIWCDVMCGF